MTTTTNMHLALAITDTLDRDDIIWDAHAALRWVYEEDTDRDDLIAWHSEGVDRVVLDAFASPVMVSIMRDLDEPGWALTLSVLGWGTDPVDHLPRGEHDAWWRWCDAHRLQ